MKYLLTGQETERLKFRLLEESDFDRWLPLFLEKNAALFLGFDVHMNSEEQCRYWFEKVFFRYENDLGGMNVLTDKKSGRLIGQCGLLVQMVEGVERLEIGYSVLPEFWRKGYASEAAMKCRDYAFQNNFAQSLISIVHVENLASEKVALKNGMKLEKTLNSYKGVPANIFRIDRKDWAGEIQ